MLIVHCSPKAVARVGAALATLTPSGWQFPSWYQPMLAAACEREQQFVESRPVTGHN